MFTRMNAYRREIGTGLMLLVIGFGVAALFSLMQFPEKSRQQAAAESAAQPADPFADIILEAQAVYVWDSARQKTLYAKNEEAQLPLASLTKLMTALVASETLPANARVTISPAAIATEGDSGLVVGESWNMYDLIGFTLMVSSNDGAAALGIAAGARGSIDPRDPLTNQKNFVSLMNKKALELGLSQTYVTNTTGLDTSDYRSGSYGSARDITRLLEHIRYAAPSLLEATQYVERIFYSDSGLQYRAKNTNDALPDIPAPLGSKTGFTDLAGGNLVVVFDASLGHQIIITVLGSTEEGRFRDVVKLVRAALQSVVL